jgi:hopanoid biosynthesis associated RND transporter like protein HpnN
MTARWLPVLVRRSTARPWVTAAVALVLAAAALVVSSRALTFQTSNVRLLPASAPYAARYIEYLRDFGELNDIVVVVQAPRPDEATRFADRLVASLDRGPLDVGRLTYRFDPASLQDRALLYLPLERLTALRDQVLDYEELLDAYAARPTLARLLEGVNERLGRAIASRFMDLGLDAGGGSDTRFLELLLEQIAACLGGQTPAYRSPWESLGEVAGPVDPRYFFSRDGRYLFVFVEARRQRGVFAESRSTVEALRGAIGALRDEFPAVEAGVTGSPAISSDEMVTAFDDGKAAGVVALVATLAPVLLAFRQVAAPMLMLGALTVSQAWTLGIITLVVGHLNIFSVMFISIVVGIGIDYGIYVLFRVQEEAGLGAGTRHALEIAARRTGPGLLLGALTAAAAFFVLTLTEFRGIQEFGLVSGIAILMAFLAMLTLFPASLVLLDRYGGTTRRGAGPAEWPLARWLLRLAAAPGWILTGAALLTALALAAAPRVRFDENMLRLQARGTESVRWEERMLAGAGRSGVSALATADSLDALRRKADAFARLPSVARVDSILSVIPEQQEEKLRLIGALAAMVESLPVPPPPAFAPAELRAPADSLGRRLTIATTEAPEPRPELQRLNALADRLRSGLRDGLDPAARASLGALQRELALDFQRQLRRLQANVEARAVGPDDVPPAIRRRHVGESGRFLMRIQPAIDVWQHAGAERFVAELRTVDPEVTGAPVIAFESIRLMKRGYLEGTVYAMLLALALTALMFRSVADTATALLPLALSLTWTLGLMPLAGLSFDLANVWALPLLIGTGAEYGVNLVARVREARTTGGPTLAPSTVLAVLLNGLTTITGFGSLMVAHHRGIFGLGLLLTIGAAASLVAALVVLPAAVELMARTGRGRRAG